jgi:hypothetical protein
MLSIFSGSFSQQFRYQLPYVLCCLYLLKKLYVMAKIQPLGDRVVVKPEPREETTRAGIVKDAEEYYRTMFHERISSWNLREAHG